MQSAAIATMVVAGLSAVPAQGATIVVFTDPMTLERKTVVVDPDGPDRAYLCVLPPSVAGCQSVKMRRVRA